MKKQLLTLIALGTYVLAFAAYVPPVRTLMIPQTTVAMVIDGVDDEACYSAEQSTDAFNPIGSTGADADYTFTFKVCYDANYLYVFAKILDDYESDWEWGGSNQWTFDNIEIFLDLDTNGSGNNPTYDSNTYQLRWNRGIDSVGNDCGRFGTANRGLHKYYWENTADGWLFESALAWKFVLGNGQKTEDILQYCDGVIASGFDMSGADSDEDGPDHRDCQTAWDNDEPQTEDDRTEDNAWNNRTVLGVITFESYYCKCVPNIENLQEDNTFEIYPNPVGEILNVDNTFNFKNARIINSMGQEILDSKCKSGDNTFNVSGLPAGSIYFLQLTDYNEKVYTAKFIKE